MRAIWKGKFFSLFPKLDKEFIRIYDRSSIITKDFLGKRVYVYNGVRFTTFLVRPLMIGLRYGNFSLTKKLGAKIHQSAKNKRKK